MTLHPIHRLSLLAEQKTDANNNKNVGGGLQTTPVKANGKRFRNGESPVLPLKGMNYTIEFMHFRLLTLS